MSKLKDLWNLAKSLHPAGKFSFEEEDTQESSPVDGCPSNEQKRNSAAFVSPSVLQKAKCSMKHNSRATLAFR
jgi:hypothetical protein